MRIGEAIVAVIGSLGRRKQPVRAVNQQPHGCTFEALVPGEFWGVGTWGGTIEADASIAVGQQGRGTIVRASIRIYGPMAASMQQERRQRWFEHLFKDLSEFDPDAISSGT